MGDRYEGVLKCPYCGKETEFYYAPSSRFESDTCNKCRKTFKIVLSFEGIKKDGKKSES